MGQAQDDIVRDSDAPDSGGPNDDPKPHPGEAQDAIVRDSDAPASKGPSDAPKPAKSKWRRRLAFVGISLPVLAFAGYLAVHNIPGFGGWLADTLRAVIGKTAVARIEDAVYAVEDFVLKVVKGDAPPEPMWEVPSGTPVVAPAPPPSTSAKAAAVAPPDFALTALKPMHKNLATKGDGKWLPLVDPRKPNDRVRMLKTFLHPDKGRSWAVVALIAIDLSSVELEAVAGKYEPKSVGPDAKAYQRPAKIPEGDFDALIAAFNGGYKSTHGDYGMKIDGVVLQPPRPLSCVVAKLKDGSYLIRDWDKVKDREPEMVWWRQTPICMFDLGSPHPALSMPSMGWGASSVSKTTVIRRSALGLNPERTVAYVAIGNHVTGRAIGEAVHHAGADCVAQLDVNFSYPKFLTYEQAGDRLKPVPLTKEFEFTDGQYVHDKSQRDFFYLLRKP
jgi:hypothetical protein